MNNDKEYSENVQVILGVTSAEYSEFGISAEYKRENYVDQSKMNAVKKEFYGGKKTAFDQQRRGLNS